MPQIFPESANRWPRRAALLAGCVSLLLVAAVAWTFSPRWTDVGYRPRQPVAFDHRLHAGELAIDCRYCHRAVETGPVAGVPETRVCMNCHHLVGRRSEALAAVRESAESGEPIRWIRVHDLPDYVFFDHSRHLAAGVACARCHGDVAAMREVMQVESLSMKWCLDCHRSPAATFRTSPAVGDPAGSPSRRHAAPTDCTACHR